MAQVAFRPGAGVISRVFQLRRTQAEESQVVARVAKHQAIGARMNNRFQVEHIQRQQNATGIALVCLEKEHHVQHYDLSFKSNNNNK